MADQKPLVIDGGKIKQIQSGNLLPSDVLNLKGMLFSDHVHPSHTDTVTMGKLNILSGGGTKQVYLPNPATTDENVYVAVMASDSGTYTLSTNATEHINCPEGQIHDLSLSLYDFVLLRQGSGGDWEAVIWTRGGRRADVQVFTSSGTWTKPQGCKGVLRYIRGGGGGGGGGYGHATTYGCAGSGGGGGCFVLGWANADDLGATETIIVGAGGPGGPGGNGGAGTNGTAGGNSAVGTSGTFQAGGGGGGRGGQSSGNNAGGGGGGIGYQGESSHDANSTYGGANATTGEVGFDPYGGGGVTGKEGKQADCGGGAGGGVGGTTAAGKAGGDSMRGSAGGGGGGSASTTKTGGTAGGVGFNTSGSGVAGGAGAGTDGASRGCTVGGGGGGAGGAGSASSNGFDGGDGGDYGGGGGGGGAGRGTGYTGGTGGTGGGGCVVMMAVF